MTNVSGDPDIALQTRLLSFIEQGLLGFEEQLEFELSAYDPQTPFYWLRSTRDQEIAFLVMEPGCLVDNYQFDLSEEDARLLALSSSEDAFVLVLMTVPENPLEMTANLLGPLIFNKTTGKGRQVVLEGSDYPVRFPVIAFVEEVSDAGTES